MASDVVREGVIAINKPKGYTSADILRHCQACFNPSAFFRPLIQASVDDRIKEMQEPLMRNRRRFLQTRRVKLGHGGTLDPLATGVLIIGIGSCTKHLPQFLDCTKTYEVVVLFGASTDSYDRVGRVLAQKPYSHITRELVEERLADFRGKTAQTPPLYSALKMNGKPLYEYAREGKPIPREIQSRQVTAEVELLEWYPPGTHEHRWPTEQADASERNIAEQVWRSKKTTETSEKMTAQEKQDEAQAIAAHESMKRDFEQRQDGLIKDAPLQRRKRDTVVHMSGALGAIPEFFGSRRRVTLPMPPTTSKDSPTPWTDEGPPACKIQLTVSSGYYVRSFCHDLGVALGSAGIMAELCRTRQSDFTIGGPNTLDYAELEKGEEVWGPQVANMIARWNGEPEADWAGTVSAHVNSLHSRPMPPSQQQTLPKQVPSRFRHQHQGFRPHASNRPSPSRQANGEKTSFSPQLGDKRKRPASDHAKSPPPNKMSAVAMD
ncbi:hypothetical protein CDD81_3647 [Ophiocordyceps australis]|uniref:tRNA pseudouridine(55) synthase n=1 Tax=Ophiocordyceps australis TaxID=1399860 RepID=A0A2C5YC16_9HYPO|nr:hypothetical protein CDD81_3647 [Ophiocordyceps australis]